MQNAVLDSAHTWFFDSLTHGLEDELIITLIEGTKGKSAELIDISGVNLGYGFPVGITEKSRGIQIIFPYTIAFFILNESYDIGDDAREKDTGKFLFKIETSSLRKFIETQTLVFTLQESCEEFLLWCEDRVFSIFTTAPPIIQQIEN